MKAHFNCQDDMNWKCTTSRLYILLCSRHTFMPFLAMICQFMQFLAIHTFHPNLFSCHQFYSLKTLMKAQSVWKIFRKVLIWDVLWYETFMVISKHCESSQPDNAKGVNEYKWPPLCSLARACMVVTWCVLSSFFCNHNSYSLMMKLITFCL